MGISCSSYKKVITHSEWEKRTEDVIKLLKLCELSNFSNIYHQSLKKEMIKLEDFLMKYDPYMYCKNPKKKQKLYNKRKKKSNNELKLLRIMWDICIICQHFKSWDLGKIKKIFLNDTYDIFCKKNKEILDLLEVLYKNEGVKKI